MSGVPEKRPAIESGDPELDALLGQFEGGAAPPAAAAAKPALVESGDPELDGMLRQFEEPAPGGDNTPSNGQQASQREVSWTDRLLSGAEGAGQGLFARAGQEFGEMLTPDLPPGTERVGGGVLEQASAQPGSEAWKLGGRALTGIPLTVLAGPGVGAQAALGASLGAANAKGDGGDTGSVATGMLTGAASGLAGGLLGKGAQYLGSPVSGQLALPGMKAATKGSELLKKLLPKAESFTSLGGLAGLPGRLTSAGIVGGMTAAPRASQALALGAGQTGAAHAGRVAGTVGSALSKFDEATTSKAGAQDRAYAGTPTTSWAVQSVLSSGTSGLSPEDEQQLTEAVMSGDPSRVVSANFRLTQKYPAYAKRMQDEYKSLQEGGE